MNKTFREMSTPVTSLRTRDWHELAYSPEEKRESRKPAASYSRQYDCDTVIVNYNAGKLLLNCVASALTAGTSNVIVVDNASTDGSIEELNKRFAMNNRLLVIRNARNLGFAAACNIGLRAAKASSILFLNPDCTLDRRAIARMSEALNQQAEVGMVGGFLCNLDGSEQPNGRRNFPTPKRAFMRAFGLSHLAKRFPRVFADYLLHRDELPKEPIAVEAISGACMLVKRDALNDVGLWDEAYFLHCEDLDWCMRFQQKGWKILYVPSAKVTHAWGACSKNRPFFVEMHKHRGMLRFYRKFFRHQYSSALWALVILGVSFRFLLASAYRFGRLTLSSVGAVRG